MELKGYHTEDEASWGGEGTEGHSRLGHVSKPCEIGETRMEDTKKTECEKRIAVSGRRLFW